MGPNIIYIAATHQVICFWRESKRTYHGRQHQMSGRFAVRATFRHASINLVSINPRRPLSRLWRHGRCNYTIRLRSRDSTCDYRLYIKRAGWCPWHTRTVNIQPSRLVNAFVVGFLAKGTTLWVDAFFASNFVTRLDTCSFNSVQLVWPMQLLVI